MNQVIKKKVIKRSVIAWFVAIFLPGVYTSNGYIFGYEILLLNLFGFLSFIRAPESEDLLILHLSALVNPIFFLTIIALMINNKVFALLATFFSVFNMIVLVLFLANITLPSGANFSDETGYLSIGGLIWLFACLSIIGLSYLNLWKITRNFKHKL